MKKIMKLSLIIFSILILILLISNKQVTSYLFGEVRYQNGTLDPGNITVPHERTIAWKGHSAFADSIYNFWARKTISENALEGKGNYPRILLAKLLTKKDIPEVNNTIIKLKAWGISGSSWALNKKGDYDFTITILTPILWFFGDKPELLYPETKEYLLNKLLTEDGNKFRYTAPKTLALVRETENHVLMTEGSRYLKNRWIMLHGNKDPFYNNVRNGMEDKLLAYLKEMLTDGLYEFNSIPYTGYTITALLNLEAFASENVRTEARNVLDYMNWCYALGSYQLRHYPPMRRRYEKASITELTTDFHSVFMKSWLSFSPVENYNTDISHAEVHALMGSCMPYRPADKVIETIFNKGNGYFIRLDHGPEACPEIYSAGKHFLLSEGGVNRGSRSLIVPRPITLFLNDKAEDLSGTFHLSGPGKDYMKWNNTGVYKNFACAAGPVIIPAKFRSTASDKNWSLFEMNDSVSVIVYSKENLGLMVVFEDSHAPGLLTDIIKANPDQSEISNHFRFPDGRKISYDVNAPKNKWVIISDNDNMMDRNFDKWPLIEGDFKK